MSDEEKPDRSALCKRECFNTAGYFSNFLSEEIFLGGVG